MSAPHLLHPGLPSTPRREPLPVDDSKERKLLRVREVAAWLAVGRSTVYELIHAGHLPALHIGRSVRIHPQAVERYLRARQEEGAR